MTNAICQTTDLDEEICDCPKHRGQQPAEAEQLAPAEPGLYSGVPDTIYHADTRSLSSSGARRLLETTPRMWKHERDNPEPVSADHFDLGTAVHTLVLGTGAPLVDLGVDEIRKDEVKKARDAHRDAGRVPLRSKHYRQAKAMADAVRRNEHATELLSSGEPELSGWYPDPVTGVMLRVRADWVCWTGPHSAILVDLKTTPHETPEAFRKSVNSFGYHAQQAWYQDGFACLGVHTEFEFIAVCDKPPHPVWRIRLPASAVDVGARMNRRAIDIYAACLESGIWPDWSDYTHEIDLPRWGYFRED
jgi:hypothetical protein